MIYADYTYYVGVFLGNTVDQADFPRLSLRASEAIDYYTRDKAKRVTDAETLDDLAKACCALAELMFSDEIAARVSTLAAQQAITSGSGEVKSETVGGYSVSYTTAADYVSANAGNNTSLLRPDYIAVLRRYLANTGLLYRGAC